jgi:F-type H+-transporting ATPase subunit gamma
MQTAEYYKRKIKNANDLQDIVHTMKVLSSVSIRQFERAAESLGEYYRSVEMGLQIILDPKLQKRFTYLETGKKSGAIIILVGSAQGLCGSFDEEIINFTKEQIEQYHLTDARFLVLGERIAAQITDQYPIEGFFELPGSVEGINGVSMELLMAIEKLQQTQKAGRVFIIHHKPFKKGRFSPRNQFLLPLDKHWLNRLAEKEWPTNNIPQYSMEAEQLFKHLVRQYLLVSLYRAMAESLAAEHTSRLNAMSAAEEKIEDRLSELNKRYAQERHKAITEELLDIQSGFRAVMGEG